MNRRIAPTLEPGDKTLPLPAVSEPDTPRDELRPSRLRKRLEAASAFLDRVPWLLPVASFAIGWLSFFLFQRGEHLARVIAVIALIGWPWLLAENLIGRWVVARSKGRLSMGAVRFVTQQIQQEILFFALPFLFGATLLVPGQVLFMALAASVALIITLDPIYLHRIAPHPGLSSALNAYCTLIAALVVLPVALHMPLDRALPMALGITALSVLASLPRMLMAVSTWRLRGIGCMALLIAFALLWLLRGWIPPAGLWVRDARITHEVIDLQPGAPIKQIEAASLHARGAAAFVSVRAPSGLSQAVVFEWRHRGKLIDPIPAEISGGREEGFRTYSRKQNFPEDSRGPWRVDLVTPDRQLIARLRFEVR
ncbi:MAG: DUF5924 family protein [Panacagrimonas sp.]